MPSLKIQIGVIDREYVGVVIVGTTQVMSLPKTFFYRLGHRQLKRGMILTLTSVPPQPKQAQSITPTPKESIAPTPPVHESTGDPEDTAPRPDTEPDAEMLLKTFGHL